MKIGLGRAVLVIAVLSVLLGVVPGPPLGDLAGLASRPAAALPAQAPPVDYESVVLGDDPVAYFRLGETSDSQPPVDEVSGMTASWTGHSLTGHAGAVPGDLAIDTTHGSMVIAPAGEEQTWGLGTSGDLSIEAWFRVSVLEAGAIFTYHAFGSDFYVSAAGEVHGDLAIKNSQGGDNSYAVGTGPGAVAADDVWHHMVVTREGTELRLYLDGWLAASTPVPAFASSFSPLGSMQAGDGLEGGLDEFAFYHHALTHAEVAEHYVASGRSLPGLSEYFGPNGAACFECWVATAADPVDTAVGNFHYPLPGLSVAGRGPGLFFGAAYNSRGVEHEGVLGAGWSSILDVRLEVDGGEATVVQEGGATVPFRLFDGEWVAPPRFTATLVEELDGSFTFTRQHLQSFRFDSTGDLVGIVDVFGNETTISYDAGLAEFMTDEAGRTLSFEWDGDRLESVTDERDDGPGPRSLEFTYDVSDRLDTFTDADGGVWHFEWDGDLLTEVRRPEAGATGPAVVNVFDTLGRVESQTDEEDRETTFDYDTPTAGTTRVTLPSGLVRDDVYAGGVLVAQTVGVGTAEAYTTTWTRDAATFAHTSMTDGDGNTWVYEVDERGNRLSATDPTGRVTRWTYNGLDQVTSVSVGETAAPLTPSTGSVVTSSFEFDDDDGRLLEAVVAEGTVDEATTTYQYTDSAHPEDLTSMTDGRGKVWGFDYDPDTGDLVETVDPEGNTATFGHNSIGWVTTQVSPRGNAVGATPADFTTTFAHDGFGRVISAAGPEGTASSWDYDGNGNLIEAVAGVGTSEELATTYLYDDSGRLTVEDPPGPGARSYTTWPDGQQHTFTNELSQTWTYGLDGLGRLATVTDPLANVTVYGYDDAGLLYTVEDAVGHVTTYLYDDAGRPSSVDYADAGTPDLTNIVYDDLGRRTAATVGATAESWGWDFASRLTSHVDVNGRTTSYGWDDTNNLTSIGYPGAGTVTRTFDDAGRLETVTDWASRVTSFDYDENGNWRETVFPSASTNVDEYEFDDADRLESITWRRGTTVQGALAYAPRDGLGNVTGVTATGTAGANVGWDYDARSRLTDAGPESFEVDPAGNLVEGPDGVLGVFDPAQRLCWTSPTATTGDCATPAADATVFEFDDAGRRTSMTLPSGTHATYGYDGAGRLDEVAQPAWSETTDEQYVPVAPAVIADTTIPSGTCDGSSCATLDADDPVEVRVAGNGGIPASGAVAVTGTITVVDPAADGWLEVNPDSGTAAAVLAAEAGTERSSGFVAALDAEGDLVLEASEDTDVVVEVSGYFRAPSPWVPAANYWPVDPVSTGTTSLPVGQTNVTVAGLGDVPSSGVAAVTVTALVQASGAGSVRFAPNGTASAGTIEWDSSFLFGSGTFTVPLNGDGTITLEADIAATVSLLSVTGYWKAPSANDVGLGLELLDGGPARILDTATGAGVCDPSPCDLVAHNVPVAVTVAGEAGVPADAEAVLVSVTVSDATAGTLFGIGPSAGLSSAVLSVESGGGAHASAIVELDDDGDIVLGAVYGDVEATIDVVGHFAQPVQELVYHYGADGLRTATDIDGTNSRQYTWSAAGGMPMLLAEHRGSASSYLVYGPGGAPLYQVTAAGDPVYFHLDHLGSVRHTTFANGTTRGSLTYSAYGETLTNTTGWLQEQPLLGYAGEYRDPVTGFIYLRARHYDPTTGLFLTRDPLEHVTREPYGYASANPANLVDPLGLAPWDGITDAVGGAVDGLVDAAQEAGGVIRGGLETAGDAVDSAWDATGGQAVSWVNDHRVGLLQIASVGLAVGAIVVTGGAASFALAAGSALLSVGAEAIDPRPCRGERVGWAAAFAGIGLVGGVLWRGAAQSGSMAADDAAEAFADNIGRAFGIGELFSAVLPDPSCGC